MSNRRFNRYFSRKIALFLVFLILLSCKTVQAEKTEFCPRCNEMRSWTDIPNYTKYFPLVTGQHSRWVGLVEKCNFCGYIDEKKMDYQVNEDHAFVNGKCICGAKGPSPTPTPAPCDHSGTTVYGREYVYTYTYSRHNDTHHIEHTTIQLFCPCGALVSETTSSDRQYHSMNGEKCSDCGYEKKATESCNHTASKSSSSSNYVAVDSRHHSYTITNHYECSCGYVNYDEYDQKTESHVISNGVCSLCDYVYQEQNDTVCQHSDFNKVVSSNIQKDGNSTTTHVVITNYVETCKCGATNPNPVDRTTVRCSSYVNIGLSEQHETNGHHYYSKCKCGNKIASDKYEVYLSSCSICQQQYGTNALAKGNDGNDIERVKTLQELLMQNGYSLPKYGADGDFGDETVAAVKKFQKDFGLPVTGIVDNATWEKLNALSQTTDDTRYELRLEDGYGTKSPDGSCFMVSKIDYAITEVYDTLKNTTVSLNESGLYITANNGCTVKGFMCTFENPGFVTLNLIRSNDKAVLDTLEIYVTALVVEDSGLKYQDNISNIVLMKDMEAFDWTWDSLLITERVAMNDFEYDRAAKKVSFEAYNAGTMIYAAISYDSNGNEISRAYIEGYDNILSIIKSGIRVFGATGRIWDTKYQNDQRTKQTNVELTVAEGGYIHIVQPDQDLDLFYLNLAESFIRLWDMTDSVKDAAAPVDMEDISKFLKTIDKGTLIEITRNVFKNGTIKWVSDVKPIELWKILFTDRTAMESVSADFAYGMSDILKNIGMEVSSQIIDMLEDIAMLSLGGITSASNVALNIGQLIADSQELIQLENDLVECFWGDMKVRVNAIMIPID